MCEKNILASETARHMTTHTSEPLKMLTLSLEVFWLKCFSCFTQFSYFILFAEIVFLAINYATQVVIPALLNKNLNLRGDGIV